MYMNIPGSGKSMPRGPIGHTADKTKSDMPGSSWTDLDLTSICGSGHKLLLLHIEFAVSDTSAFMQFRTKGYTGFRDDHIVRSLLTGTSIHHYVFIETDNDGLISWYGASKNVTSMSLSVFGWWDL